MRQHSTGAPTGAYDTTSYTFNRSGHLAAVTDPAGNTWRYEYDLRGRQIAAHDPDKGTTVSSYNDGGELVSTVDGRGTGLAYVYDAIGRLTSVHDGSPAGPKRIETIYDTLLPGAVTATNRYASGGTYATRVLGYDSAGRPTGTAVTIPAAEAGLAGTYEFPVTYTANGEPASTSLPAVGGLAAETISHRYDEFGLPATTMSNRATYVSQSEYSEFGEPLRIHLGTATPARRVWRTLFYEDGTRRLLRAVTDRETTGSRQADLTYAYDQSGQITKIADRPTAAPSETQCFQHDHLGRLAEAWTATNDCTTAPSTGLIGGPAPYWHTFTYDKVGNRLTETRHATGGDSARAYSYPPGKNTLQAVRTNGPGGERLDEYAYDAAGNMTSRRVGAGPQTLAWDAEGRLSSVTENGKQTSFLYDANGQRLLRRDATGTTLYLGATELRRNDATGHVTAVRHYTHDDEVVAVRTGAGVTWLIPDHHGTNETAIDADDLSVSRRRHTPFGQPRDGQPAWPDERGFVGGIADTAIGLTTLGARQYEADTGRFISVDPLIDTADPRTMHPYAYAHNNPVTHSDPTGLRLCEFCDGSDGNSSMEKDSRRRGASPNRPDPYDNPDVHEAQNAKRKSILDVVREAGGKILQEVLGLNDVRDCVTKGNVAACISVIVGAVPWGKVFKAIKAAWKAVRAVIAWRKKVEWAVSVLKRADEAAAAAAKQADEAVATAAKNADDAAKQAADKADDAAKKGDDGMRRDGGGEGGPDKGRSPARTRGEVDETVGKAQDLGNAVRVHTDNARASVSHTSTAPPPGPHVVSAPQPGIDFAAVLVAAVVIKYLRGWRRR